MEPEKLEEYKEATGIALLNAYSNGLLSREEYQLIQKFKREKWNDVGDFLKSVSEKKSVSDEEKDHTNNVYSTNVEYTKDVESDHTKNVESTNNVPSIAQKEYTENVDSTKNEDSISVESLIPRTNLTTGTYNETNIRIPVLSNVNIKSNFTKFDNEVSDHLNNQQTPLEQSVYNRLYRLSVGWGRNYCRISAETLMKSCNIKDRRTLNSGIDGLIEKGHIQIINRNNKGILYKIFFPHEILNNESNTKIEMTPITNTLENTSKEYTRNVESSKKSAKEYTKNVDSTKIPPFKDLKDIFKDSLSFKDNDLVQDIISSFYEGIKQEKIPREKRERAEVNIKRLLEEGFTLEEIKYAVIWTLTNAREEPYDFSLVNYTIGQAKAAKIKAEEENAQKLERDRIKEQQQLEESVKTEKRAKIKIHKESLTKKEREVLRKKAEEAIRKSGQYREEFITDMLIEIKENELVADVLGISLSETA